MDKGRHSTRTNWGERNKSIVQPTLFRWKPTALFSAMKLGVWEILFAHHIASPFMHTKLFSQKSLFLFFLARHIAKEIMEKWKFVQIVPFFFFLQTFFEQGLALGLFR